MFIYCTNKKPWKLNRACVILCLPRECCMPPGLDRCKSRQYTAKSRCTGHIGLDYSTVDEQARMKAVCKVYPYTFIRYLDVSVLHEGFQSAKASHSKALGR
jgi:hypothetical protein